MERRTFIWGAFGVAALGAAGCSSDADPVSPPESTAPRSAQPPNVIVIYMDDMRLDGLDYMPKCRALFDHRFTQARANGGACTDTRLGLFTGTYILHHPWKAEVTNEEHDPSKTWGPWVHDAGYHTALFGKYITTDVWPFGIEAGWDTWRAYYSNPDQAFGFEIDTGEDPIAPIAPEGRNLDYMIGELISFATGSAEPWFASWNPYHPHSVTATGEVFPRPEDAQKWPSLPSPVPVNEDVTGKPAWVQALEPVTPTQELDIRRAQRGQAQVLSGVDDAIGDLFEALDDAGILENTVIFFSSDQGVHYGEHRWGAALGVPAAVQKQTLYDPVVHVPLLATGPGFAPGVTTVPVSQVDITATVVAIAGATPSHPLDGIDLRTVVADPAGHADRVILLQARTFFSPSPSHDTIVNGPDHPTYPLRKLARLHTGEYELYDLDADPGEFVNLADHPDRLTERNALESVLDELLQG